MKNQCFKNKKEENDKEGNNRKVKEHLTDST